MTIKKLQKQLLQTIWLYLLNLVFIYILFYIALSQIMNMINPIILFLKRKKRKIANIMYFEMLKFIKRLDQKMTAFVAKF